MDELKRLLKEELLAILTAANSRPAQKVEGTPEVILVVGVNGTGKTTTIGKLAQVFRSQGKTVLLCAADTFRAAAIEQLEIWGQRTGTEVIKTKPGGDPAAVLFDALQAATARKTRLRHRRHRRPPAHQNQPDGGTGEDAAHRAAHHPRARRTKRCW